MDYRIEDIPKNNIALIKPVWEKLNQIHLEDSVFFKDHYKSFTFENRIKDFELIRDEDMKISVVYSGVAVKGYCLSIIADGNGEVESLCLLEEMRGNGMGKEIVENHIQWMKKRNCKRIRVSVSYGHDSVLEFYNKLGFKERLTVLEYRK